MISSAKKSLQNQQKYMAFLKEYIERYCTEFSREHEIIYLLMAQLYTILFPVEDTSHLTLNQKQKFYSILSKTTPPNTDDPQYGLLYETIADLAADISLFPNSEGNLAHQSNWILTSVDYYKKCLEIPHCDQNAAWESIANISEKFFHSLAQYWPAINLAETLEKETLIKMAIEYMTSIDHLLDTVNPLNRERLIADVYPCLWLIVRLAAPFFTNAVDPFITPKEFSAIFSHIKQKHAQDIFGIKMNASVSLERDDEIDVPPGELLVFTPAEVKQPQVGSANKIETSKRFSAFLEGLREGATLIQASSTDDVLALIKACYGIPYWNYLCLRVKLSNILGFPIPVDDLMQPHETMIDQVTLTSAINSVAAALSACRADTKAAIVLTRPPGHHASPRIGPTGFCLFSSAAIAAFYSACKLHEKTCVIDIDIHPGNGTRDVLSNAAKQEGGSNLFFLDMLGDSVWRPADATEKEEQHNIKEAALPPGTRYNSLGNPSFKQILFSELRKQYLDSAQGPKRIIISGGFDSHKDEEMISKKERLGLQSEDYGQILQDLHAEYPEAQIIFLTEGGYHYDTISSSMHSVARAARSICAPSPQASLGY